MTKDLDKKVAHAMGLKSVNNCEKWGTSMTQEALKLALEFIENSECGTADLEARIKEALAKPERDYERGFIDGMQKQMQSSVDKAVNAMSQRTWVEVTDEEIKAVRHSFPTGSIDDLHSFARAILNKSKEKNT